MVAFTVLAGFPPFNNPDQKELVREIKNGNWVFDEAYWGEISEEAKDLIESMLTVDYRQRPSAEACLDHLFFSRS